MDIVKSLTTLEKQAIERLKSHDWYHMMSDSNSVHFDGEKNMNEILEMLSFFDFEYARKIYKEYSPDDFSELHENRYDAAKKRVSDKLMTGVSS